MAHAISAPQPAARVKAALSTALPPLLVALLALSFWYLLSVTVYAGKGYLLPGPREVADAFVENGATIMAATLTTLKEAMLGYLAAIGLGVLSAAILSQSRILERSFYPYAVLLQTVPVVAIAPLVRLQRSLGHRHQPDHFALSDHQQHVARAALDLAYPGRVVRDASHQPQH